MAWVFTANLQPGTSAAMVYALKTLLKSAGWTVPSSSDGTTYNAAGDQITAGGSGAHGMANTKAWFRLRMPNGAMEFTFQFNSNNAWRVKWSCNGTGFTGGSPAAQVTPSAADEAVERGGGSDAVPTFASLWHNDGAAAWVHLCAETVAPYRFGLYGHDDASGTLQTKLILDALLDGSYPAGDTAPYVLHLAHNGGGDVLDAGNLGSALSSNPYSGRTWMNKPSGTHEYVAAMPLYYGGTSTTFAPNTTPANPVTATFDLLPVVYGRPSSVVGTTGYKGVSTMLRWAPLAAHGTGDLYSVDGTVKYAKTSDCAVLWPGGAAWSGTTGGTSRVGVERVALAPYVAPAATPPTVTVVSPPVGTVIGRHTPLVVQYTDDADVPRLVVVHAAFPRATPEVVCTVEGDDPPVFSYGYEDSTAVAVTRGYQLSIVRRAGWTAAPTLHPFVVDRAGAAAS